MFAFASEGISITGATYVRRQFGRAPKDILKTIPRLVQSGASVERKSVYGGYSQTQFVSLTVPDISGFSPQQISLVDGVLAAICFNQTETSIFPLSHDIVWESAQIGEEIPMPAAAFAGNVGEIDEDDMAWAFREIDRIEAGRAHA